MARPRFDTIKVPTQTRILDAAERHFGGDGFAGAALADIAADAGIKRASLLYHFRSKELLYQAVLERLFTGLGQALAPILIAETSFADRLMATTQAYLDYLDERPAFAALVIRDLMDDRGDTRAQIFALLDPLISMVEAWVAREGEGVVAADLDVRAALLVICSDALLRKGSGSLGPRLWGTQPQSLQLSKRLFFGD